VLFAAEEHEQDYSKNIDHNHQETITHEGTTKEPKSLAKSAGK